MISFYSHLIKSFRLIPPEYKKKAGYFTFLSFANLVLDVFSIGIIFPLMLAILDSSVLDKYPFLNTFLNNKNLFITVFFVAIFFVVKNNISIKIFKYQTKMIYGIASSISLKFISAYLFNDYLIFKDQKKSELVKDVINTPHNFADHILLSGNIIIVESFLLLVIISVSLFINPIATLIAALILISTIAIVHYLNRQKLKRINQYISAKYSDNITNLLNIVQGYFEIKTSNKEYDFLNRFKISNTNINEVYSELRAERMASSKYSEIIVMLALCTLVLLTHIVSVNQELNMVFISFLIAASLKIIPALGKVLNNYTNFKANIHFQKRQLHTQKRKYHWLDGRLGFG